jgi:cation transport ATPase
LTDGAVHPTARARPGTLAVTDDRVFGPGGEALARRFARRVLWFGEVSSLALDPTRASATVNYRPANGDPVAFLTQLADAGAGAGEELDGGALPHWPDGEPVTLHRYAGIVSLLEILTFASGRLVAHHPAIARDPAMASRVENALRVVPGMIEATATSAKAELRVRFKPRVVTAGRLIRLAEAELLGLGNAHAAPSPEQVDFAPANVSLGIAATGEFVLPLVTPVTAGMLVLSNLETFRAATHQAREGKFGLPLLYTSIVGVTLASGQFLSAALMFWFFRYWEHRYRQDLKVENQAILEETVRVPEEARVVAADGLVRPVPSREVAAGQRVRVLAGEIVPADARVLAGAALLDETTLRGTLMPMRRVAGDEVLAGSKLAAGALDLEVLRTGNETKAARIAQALIATTVPTPRSWALNEDGEEFAGRAVAPTLLAAGAGLIVGDLTTAGAILRPDYATGVGLAVPLETLRDVKLAIRNGAVVRLGNAFGRLATTSWIILDDHEALHHLGCDVAEMRTNRLDEARLLLAAAAAGAWLGDERGPALARACRERGLIVRRAGLREIDADGVVVDYRAHTVRLRGRPVAAATEPPPLIIEVDGVEAGGVRFCRNGRMEAAAAVRWLQQGGLRLFLTSERATDATAHLALQLGVDRHCGGMRLNGKIRLLRELRQQGVAAAFVGDCLAEAAAAREAHLAIALAGADALGGEPSDVVLLGPSIVPLPALFALARDRTRRIERARHMVMAPNLLCVAGAFAFGLTGMAAVIISNFGTSMVYNGAMRSLRTAEDTATRPDIAWDLDDREATGPIASRGEATEARRSA